jgi:hypothetical protein
MKPTLLLLGLLIGFFSICQGQATADKEVFVSPEWYDGTYQVEVFGTRAQPQLPSDIDVMIEDARKEAEEVLLPISKYVRVRILPTQSIFSPGFSPYSSWIKYVEE